MNLDQLNRYVLASICVFAGLLYVGMVYAGFSELVSRISKRGVGGKQGKSGRARRLPNAKKSA